MSVDSDEERSESTIGEKFAVMRREQAEADEKRQAEALADKPNTVGLIRGVDY